MTDNKNKQTKDSMDIDSEEGELKVKLSRNGDQDLRSYKEGMYSINSIYVI